MPNRLAQHPPVIRFEPLDEEKLIRIKMEALQKHNGGIVPEHLRESLSALCSHMGSRMRTFETDKR